MKSIQSKLEYMFYCTQPLRREQHEHMHQFTTVESISEHGFPNLELYKVSLLVVVNREKKDIFFMLVFGSRGGYSLYQFIGSYRLSSN